MKLGKGSVSKFSGPASGQNYFSGLCLLLLKRE